MRRPVPGPADSPALNAFPCTVQVESVDRSLSTGGELGAEVALPKMAVTGVGWLATPRTRTATSSGCWSGSLGGLIPNRGRWR